MMSKTILKPEHIITLNKILMHGGICTYDHSISCWECPFNNTSSCYNDYRMVDIINNLLAQNEPVQLELFSKGELEELNGKT